MTSIHEQLPQSTDPEHFFREVYGAIDYHIRDSLFEQLGGNLPEHVRCLEQYGVTKLSGLFSPERVAQMQADVAVWRTAKGWNQDGQVGFDGGRREAYLPTSRALSEAVTHPAIFATMAATFGQHPRVASVSTYSIDPVGPEYQETFPFQWHHDGSSEYGIRAMILLSDVPDDGQAMRICPGTSQHRWPSSTARETQFDSNFADSFEQYVCSGKAGDVILFNPHALHKGTRNASMRRDVTAVYFQPGLARNFQLPGLHPDMAADLSEYQRSVYRVGDEATVAIDVNTLPNATAVQRENMSAQAARWSLPVKQIRAALDASPVDESITVLGEENRRRLARIEPQPKEQVAQETIGNLRAGIEFYSSDYRAFLSSADAPAYVAQLRNTIHDEWRTDFDGELDLPIRMYNPSRDQRQNEAISSIRSRAGELHLMNMAERLNAITPVELATVKVEAYAGVTDLLASISEQLLGTMNKPRARQQAEAFLRFAEDIQEMLHRAHSVQLIRRTLLFAHLTYANLYGLYAATPGADPELLGQLAVQTTQTLRYYAGMVTFDHLIRR